MQDAGIVVILSILSFFPFLLSFPSLLSFFFSFIYGAMSKSRLFLAVFAKSDISELCKNPLCARMGDGLRAWR
ncbi:hypothetical protein V8C37DRAFT_381681 [Trichoderma ceciliae]